MGQRLTTSQILNLTKRTGQKIDMAIPEKTCAMPKEPNKGEATFWFWWQQLAPDLPVPQCEFTTGQFAFSETRGWLLDFCWLYPWKVAVEIHGGVHAIKAMRERDAAKGNALAEAGFTLLQFTVDMVLDDPAACVDQVRRLLQKDRSNEPITEPRD